MLLVKVGRTHSFLAAATFRAYAFWEGWFGYDRKKYATMLREAFQPSELPVAKPASQETFRCRARRGASQTRRTLLLSFNRPSWPQGFYARAQFPASAANRA